MKNQIVSVVDSLRAATSKGAKFLSFLYQSKGTGEVSIYTINFGINYDNACKADKAILEAYEPKNDLEQAAKEKMLLSVTQHLTEGVSQAYTQKDTYTSIGNGIKIHNTTGEISIYGFVQSKVQVSPPTIIKKPVKSSAATLAKKNIEKVCEFKRNKFANFLINPENIAGLKVNGEVIELQSL